MISKETLEAVNVGILTDKQLDEAIRHYTTLQEHLECHGELYRLTWLHVFHTLNTLNGFKEARKRNKKQNNEN